MVQQGNEFRYMGMSTLCINTNYKLVANEPVTHFNLTSLPLLPATPYSKYNKSNENLHVLFVYLHAYVFYLTM